MKILNYNNGVGLAEITECDYIFIFADKKQYKIQTKHTKHTKIEYLDIVEVTDEYLEIKLKAANKIELF